MNSNGVILDPILIHQPTSPLIKAPVRVNSFDRHAASSDYCDQFNKILFIVTGTFVTAFLIYNIYNGLTTFQAQSLTKTEILTAITQVAGSALAFLCCSAMGGAYFARDQNLIQSLPDQENIQSSVPDYFEEKLIDKPHRFAIEIVNSSISKFLNQFEPVLLSCYFSLHNLENGEEKKIEHLAKILETGCCFGYSIALLSMMRKQAKSSSNELMASIDVLNVIYYQLTYLIMLKLRSNQETYFYPAAYFDYQSLSETNCSFFEYAGTYINSMNTQNDPYSNKLFFHFFNFDSAGIYSHMMSDRLLVNEMQESNLSDHFDAAQKAITKQIQQNNLSVDQMTIAGYVRLLPPQNRVGTGAHTFFFQMSDGYFRFYDSGSQYNHFFEFSTKELMFKGLIFHIKTCWKSFLEGEFFIVLLGIPHS